MVLCGEQLRVRSAAGLLVTEWITSELSAAAAEGPDGVEGAARDLTAQLPTTFSDCSSGSLCSSHSAAGPAPPCSWEAAAPRGEHLEEQQGDGEKPKLIERLHQVWTAAARRQGPDLGDGEDCSDVDERGCADMHAADDEEEPASVAGQLCAQLLQLLVSAHSAPALPPCGAGGPAPRRSRPAADPVLAAARAEMCSAVLLLAEQLLRRPAAPGAHGTAAFAWSVTAAGAVRQQLLGDGPHGLLTMAGAEEGEAAEKLRAVARAAVAHVSLLRSTLC